jgi:hypothetical protein
MLLLASTPVARAEILPSNLDTMRKDARPSPFTSGNGKAVDFTVRGARPFEVSEVVLRLKLAKDSRPVLRVVEKPTADRLARVPLNHAAGLDVPGSTHALASRPARKSERAGAVDVVFVPENPLLLWPGAAYRLALSTETKRDGMVWLAGDLPECNEGEAGKTVRSVEVEVAGKTPVSSTFTQEGQRVLISFGRRISLNAPQTLDVKLD